LAPATADDEGDYGAGMEEMCESETDGEDDPMVDPEESLACIPC